MIVPPRLVDPLDEKTKTKNISRPRAPPADPVRSHCSTYYSEYIRSSGAARTSTSLQLTCAFSVSAPSDESYPASSPRLAIRYPRYIAKIATSEGSNTVSNIIAVCSAPCPRPPSVSLTPCRDSAYQRGSGSWHPGLRKGKVALSTPL